MGHFVRSLLDLISPRACKICGKRLAVTEEEICGVCNWHLPRTHFCANAEENELARLFWGKIPIEKATSLMFYKPHDKPSRMIYDLKYHGDKYLGLWLGRLLTKETQAKEMIDPLLSPIKGEGENEEWEVENGERKTEKGEDSNFFEGIDMIIPVPISRGRRWRRGYNQSELIARGISEVTGIPIRTDILRRVHFDRSQTKLTVLERTENVEHAFELKAAKAKDVSGKHILLVDDIITTGATITACAKELMKASDVKFSVASVGFTK